MTRRFEPRVARKHVGTYRPRVDGEEKASGRAMYADDVTTERAFPDLLYAKVMHSPHPHARVVGIDTSRARALPGVEAILTFEDPEVAAIRPTSAGWTDGVDTVTYDRMMWRRYKDRRVLDREARWVGDEVAVAVAARSERIAEQALRLVEIEWEILPFVLDPHEASRPGAPVLHPGIAPDNVLPADDVGGPDVFVIKGDVEAALAGAEVVVEAASTYHNAVQGSLDNWCCLARWQDGGLTIWSNSYEADQTRMHVSEMLGVPVHRVRVVSPYVGGQFGRADTGDQPFFLITALLARRAGRPVKFRHTRRESFFNSRQPAIYSSKWGARTDGTITVMQYECLGNAGAYADHTMFALKFAPKEITEVALAHVPNVRMSALAVYTNVLPACMMRGVGNVQFNIILGLMVDVLAERLGMDPIDLVVKNFGHEWESLPDKSLDAVLHAGAERIGWKKARHAPGAGPAGKDRKRRGVGFSFHPGWHAEWQETRRGPIQVAVTLNHDCTLRLDAPTVETGPGSNTCNVLGCAEAFSFLGIGVEDITWVSQVDTGTGLKDTVQTDSAVSFLQSEALVEAAREMKRRLAGLAAAGLGAAIDELDVADGRVFVKADPARCVGVREMLAKGDLVPITVMVARCPCEVKTGIPYMASFAAVAVDTGTGKVEVERIVLVNDCGTVMYASGAEAQQLGGQTTALGETLTEEIVYDRATGVPLNFNWIDYRIPTMADMPDIDPVLLEVWKGAGEYGACGIGEGVVTCTPRAILNAVYNATGVRMDEIPLTPEKVLAALGNTLGEVAQEVVP